MIVFKNDGGLDLRAISTFGVSSKETSNAIGFFGTGLKYAIAILLREGCEVEIVTNNQHVTFVTEPETIRVDEFDTVFMIVQDGTTKIKTRLGFTTELGKKWELWQAYRELYCNCIDEPNPKIEKVDAKDIGLWLDGVTYINVRGKKFEDVHNNRFMDVLCPPNTTVYDDGHICEIRAGQSSRVYYREMRALELSKPALFTYNVRMSMELTEDRNIKYQFRAAVAVGSSLTMCEDRDLIKKILLAEDHTFEASIDFDMCPGVKESVIFKEVVREVANEHPSKINKSAMSAINMKLAETLPEHTGRLDDVDARRLDRAIAFCKSIGYEVEKYPIIVVSRIDTGVLGMAHNGKIYVSSLAFEQGTKIVAGTLIEEYLHLKHHVDDMTRELQNILIDKIVSLGERVNGDVL